MNTTNNNRPNRSLLGFFRRGERWREIPPGYRAGDIRSDIPIAILPDASVLGNVFAPKILVEGVLYGSAVALEVIIEADGQVWGDVHSGRLQVEPGGKLQGWVSNLDEVDFESLLVKGLIPDESQEHTIELSQLPAEVVESGDLARNEDQVNVLRRLQMESAAALAARDELERAFEKRLSETAGEATARAASLHEELSGLRLELTTMREDRDELREELRERTAQVERQANEIITARDLLTDRDQELAGLQQTHETKLVELAELLQAKESVDHTLLETNREIDALTDRARSLEGALQNSLQHASEQEESLIRWQELAEVTDTKVQTLQAEIGNLKFEAEENGRLHEMLRAQRQHAEDAWQEVREELEQLRQRELHHFVPPEVMTELEEQVKELRAALTQAEIEAETYRQTLDTQATEWQNRHEAEVSGAKQEAADVKQELERMQELMLWDKATLDTTQTALEQAQADVEEKQTAVTKLQAQLEAKQVALTEAQSYLNERQMAESTLAETIQTKEKILAKAEDLLVARGLELTGLQEKLTERDTAVARLQATVAELTAEVETNKRQLSDVQEQAVLEASELRERVRQAQTQLEAQEVETEDYFQQMQGQGQRLAEIQATLIEREIALNELTEMAEKQKVLISRMKDVTSERMNKLNGELNKTRQQLKQAIAMVNKMRGGK